MLIVDTAGRLHIDQELMAELAKIRKRTKPDDVLLVVDAMTGQDAVGVAESFAEAAEFDGVVMTKLDGDARGGAALSVKAVTGKPILFASTGEKIEDFERFHPDRMAQRILGMGDVLSLIEKAEQQVDEKRGRRTCRRRCGRTSSRSRTSSQQMRQVRKMGPLSGIIGMLPGMGAMKQLKNADIDEGELDRVEAIILSMTPAERADPGMINGSRRKRIANGSGTRVQHVNQLVKQFDQMRMMMRSMASGKMPDPQQLAQMTAAPHRARRSAGANLSRLMAVRIRLRRVGSKKNPIWRIVVADKRSPRDGRTIETIGQYNPQTEPSTIEFDEERARHWLEHGAQPSETVAGAAAHQGHRRLRQLAGAAMTELLEFLVKALVEEPEAVVVEELEEDGDLIYEITVADGDLGRVIGKGGRVANAIRTIAKAAAVRIDRRVIVDILD